MGASLRETGSREPDPICVGSGPSGFDPARGAVPRALFDAIGGIVSMCAEARDTFPDAETSFQFVTDAINELYGCIEDGVFYGVETEEDVLGEALMSELGELWMDYVGRDHHKDRDCHFVIEQYFSYGQRPYWTAYHAGYVDDGFGLYSGGERSRHERRFPSYSAALHYCIGQTMAMFRRHHKDLPGETVGRLKLLSAIAMEARRGETTGSTAEGGDSAGLERGIAHNSGPSKGLERESNKPLQDNSNGN